jgi:CHAT domain-containing protein/tetratricopeptide (TPR) repeat protein
MAMRSLLFAGLMLAASETAADPPTQVKAGAESVEELLHRCRLDGVIVAVRDPKTGKTDNDPKLGIPRFIVPDHAKLASTIKANRALMEPTRSRHVLIGCTKLAAPTHAPGWVALLRAVGRELNDPVSIELSYHIAARHGLPEVTRKGGNDLNLLVQRALAAGGIQYHRSASTGWAWLSVPDAAKLRDVLEKNRNLLRTDVIEAAIVLSRTRMDYGPLLGAIGEFLPDATATAYAAEYAARNRIARLEPGLAAKELETAAKEFANLHDTPSKARVLTTLGKVRRELGEYDLALANYREARRILERVHEAPHPDLAALHLATAELHLERGEAQRALVSYLDSVRLRHALPPEHEDFVAAADTMRVFAAINAFLGYREEARENLRDVLFLLSETDELVPGSNTQPVRASCLHELGRLALRQGRTAAARKWLDKALDIRMRLEGGVHPTTIETLLALGQACAAGGEYGQAEFLTRQALIFLTHHYGPHHPAVVRAHAIRVEIYLTRGAFQDARAEIARGLDSARVLNASTVTEDPSDYLPTRDTVSLLIRHAEQARRAAERQQDSVQQAALLRDAVTGFLTAEQVLNRVRDRMPGEDDRLLTIDRSPEIYAGLLGCYRRVGQRQPTEFDGNAVFAAAERATARSLLETLGQDVAERIAGLPDDIRAEKRRLFLAQDAALREFNRLPYENNQKPTPAQEAAWKKYKQANQELSDFFNRVARKYPSQGAGTPTTCTPGQALEVLRPNEAALSFVLGRQESFAVVLHRGSEGPVVSLFPLPPVADLDAKVTTLTEPEVLRSPLARQVADELSRALWAPLADSLKGRDLVIVPTGPLCRLPFELLREQGPDGRKYLGETRTIRYAPSLTVLRLLRERQKVIKDGPDRPVWVMADPLVPAVPVNALSPAPLPPLPKAVAEAQMVVRSLGSKVGLRIGKDATRVAILKTSASGELRRYRVLHFAVHAATEAYGGLMPGLVLGRSPGDDGYLNMEDVSRLDLNADLVVLSACQSGVGRVYNGEGIRGLTGSFLVAGSRAVICSLWKVEDTATAQFMEAFYTRLQGDARAAEVLRDIRQAIASRKAPADWAAFVLVGE